MSKIKLLLADDHTVLRAGLKALFNAQPDMEVVAEASDGEEAIRMSRELSPDVVLMDISMPGINGFKATSEIRKQNPAVKILALTMHEDDSYLHQMLRAGADGYVPKKAADTELMAAIRASYRGEHFIHSSVASGLVTMARQQEPELLKSSRHHTHYFGDGANKGGEMHKIVFINGVAHEVSESDYERAKDTCGKKLVDVNKPTID